MRSLESVVWLCAVAISVSCVTPSTTEVKPWDKMDKPESASLPTAPPPKETAARPKPPAPPPAQPPRAREQPAKPPTTPTVNTTAAASSSLGPRISRSLGQPGGFVVLWPRIIPSSGAEGQRALALQMQSHISTMVSRQAGGRPVDVRPEPERACPRASGCQATTASVLLIHHTRGCVAVGMFTPPGTSNTRLVPLAGLLTLKSETVPFRSLPESQVVVHDFMPCDQVMREMMGREADIESALRSVGR
ncbi:MAG: hypothetical protein AAFX99_03465 [Myxococcota bacterium]